MPQSPALRSTGVVRVLVKSDGTAIADTIGIVSLRVRRALGMVGSAQLVVSDGDMPTGAWPVADAATFKPGASITIEAGYDDTQTPIFQGVVVQLGMRIDGENRSTLVVECRHKAVAMTVGRRNAVFTQLSDDKVISKLAGAHKLSVDVDATATEHGVLVQYHATDWDFLLARAEANGLLVVTTDRGLQVRKPASTAGGAAPLKVTWGEDLIEFRAELDARQQLKKVTAVAWDPKTQERISGQSAAPEAITAQGDLDAAALAGVLGVADFSLQAPVAAAQDELTAWGAAQQVKAALARIRGRMKFQGTTLALPATPLDVAGVGARYNGTVFVTAVEHEITDGNWITSAEFGQDTDWFCARPDVSTPAASALLPAARGLHVGVVKKLDADPAGELRIQLLLPVLDAAEALVWARLAQFHASSGFGAFFVPEVGDEVVVGFFNEDPGHPVVLGSLYSSKRKAKLELAAPNNLKSLTTRSGHRFEFDDENKVVTLVTPGSNQLVLSDKDQSITLKDQNGNEVKLAPGGITLDTPKDVKVTAKGSITLDAVGAITLSSKADVKCEGLNVACQAQVGFTGKGSATAELSAAGQTTVKGAMVMIN